MLSPLEVEWVPTPLMVLDFEYIDGQAAGDRGGGEKTYILQGPAFCTFMRFLTGDRSRPTPVRVAIKSDHDILP